MNENRIARFIVKIFGGLFRRFGVVKTLVGTVVIVVSSWAVWFVVEASSSKRSLEEYEAYEAQREASERAESLALTQVTQERIAKKWSRSEKLAFPAEAKIDGKPLDLTVIYTFDDSGNCDYVSYITLKHEVAAGLPLTRPGFSLSGKRTYTIEGRNLLLSSVIAPTLKKLGEWGSLEKPSNAEFHKSTLLMGEILKKLANESLNSKETICSYRELRLKFDSKPDLVLQSR